ncbi:MAG: T9SS type A sorting domain-containing protein [Bacteroidetes bacterium]|nr:T9SS type A sorting domain-containing protein [Bacteroidota bacterium]
MMKNQLKKSNRFQYSESLIARSKKLWIAMLPLLLFLVSNISSAQTPVPMSSQIGLTYTENFNDIASWTSITGPVVTPGRWNSYPITPGGSANDGKRTTKSSVAFTTTTGGGVQKGTNNLVFLSTGSGATSEAVAVDLLLDFTGVNAGTLSYNWAAVDNSSGTRPTSLRIFWSTDNVTFTEIAAAQVLDVQTVNSGSITAVALPSAFNNVSTARLRFYNHAGTVTGAGSRDKISIDDVTVTATAMVVNPTKLAITSISPASPTENANFSVTVQAQDAGSVARNVVASTDFTLSVASGTGAIGGTFSGTIAIGTSSITLNSVTYNTAEAGVSLTATRTAGDVLTSGTSSTFTVAAAAAPLITITGSLTPFSTVVGTPSAVQSYQVSGINLATDIVIDPPADFEIRTGVNAFSTSNINLAGTTVPLTTIDVRYNPASAGSIGPVDITHTTTGDLKNQSVSGSSIATEPTSSSVVTFGTITSSSIQINLTGGNGARRFVIIKPNSAVIVFPSDGGTLPGGIDASYTTAADLGSGEKIIYDGTGTTVTVTDLSAFTTYHVAVYEYNGNGATSNYNTTTQGINNTKTLLNNAVPVSMASLSYSENFANVATWSANFASGAGASPWSSYPITPGGSSNDGIRTTKSSTAFSTSFSGGVQIGTGNLVFLSTGSGAVQEAVAVDFLMDFTGVNAGNLSFDWAAIDNSSGTRPTTLRVYWSTDNVTFTEIPAALILDVQNTSPINSGTISVPLPTNFTNSPTARLRFYNHAGAIVGGGNRDKISIDNLLVTATLPTKLAVVSTTPANPIQNANFSVTVQAQDATNTPQNVLTATDFTISLASGTGALGGTLTGQIAAGSNQATITGVTYNVIETITITATRTAGDVLTAGTSGNITIDAPATPTITLSGSLTSFLTGVGTQSTPSQTYTVEGSDLTADLQIAPPVNFEVSLDEITWVANPNTLDITPVGVTVAPTTIFVRYAPGTPGPHSANIAHTSTGAVTKNEAVSGTTSAAEPTISSVVSIANLTTSTAIVNFLAGNGANRIVVAREGAAVSFVPTDGTAPSGVDSDFGNAVDQGSGNKIVYDGSGTTVTVTNLTSGSTYHFAVYEYNGTAGTVNYRATPGIANATIPAPIPYSGGTYTQNFNSLPLAGSADYTGKGVGPFFTVAPPLSAGSTNGWQFAKANGAGLDAKFAIDNGIGTTASAYSYGTTASNDRALGSLAGGQVISRLGAIITNTSGGPLSEITISYTGEQWRDGGSTNQNTLSFSYQVGGTDISTGSFTAVSDLNFSNLVHGGLGASLDGNQAANRSAKTATFCVGTWAPGQTLVIRWDDADEVGSDDGLAIDDFSFSAAGGLAPSCVTVTPNNTACITATSLSWNTAGPCASYKVYVAKDNPMTDFIVYEPAIGSALSYTLPTLDPNIPYYYQVIPFNDFGDAVGCTIGTFNSGPSQSVTPVVATNVLPAVTYTLGGEGVIAPALPCGVTVENGDQLGTSLWYTSTAAPRTGANHMRIDKNPDNTNPLDDYFFTVPINVTIGKVYRASWYDRTATGAFTETYEMRIATLPDASTMSGSSADLFSTNSMVYTQKTGTDYLAPFTGVIYFGFRATSQPNQGSLYIDDVTISEVPVPQINPVYCTTIPSMYDQIFVTPIAGATNYRFKIVGTGGQAGYNFEHYRNNSNPDYRLKWAPGVIYGYTYNVQVASFKNGVWSPYGPSCPVSLGAFPTIKLRNNPATVAGPCDYVISDLNDRILTDSLSGANDYMYRIVEDVPGGAYDYDHTWQRSSGNLDFRLVWAYQSSPLVDRVRFGFSYDVQTRALVGKTGVTYGNRPGEWGPYGTTCKLDLTAATPTTTLTNCNVSLSSLNDQFFIGGVTGATNYQYEFSAPGFTTATVYRGNGNLDFRMIWLAGVKYGTTFSVRVKAYVGGVWLNYGTPCTVITPAAPSTSVLGICGTTLSPGQFSSTIFCTAVPGASLYSYRITNVGGVPYSKVVYNYNSNNSFSLSRTLVCCGYQNMLPNATYTIEVAYYAGEWSAYGPVCTFTTGATVPRYSPFASEGVEAVEGALNLSVYPNPATVNQQFALELQGITAANEKVQVRIFNMIGDKVYSADVITKEEAILTIKPEMQLAAGVYMAEAQINGNVYRVKFVVK